MPYEGPLKRYGKVIGEQVDGIRSVKSNTEQIADLYKEQHEREKIPLAERVIAAIEEHYVYPAGPKAMQMVRLLDHEKDFIENALEPQIREAALSLPRGNNKTGLVAMITAEAVCGELAQHGADVMLVAASIDQGGIAFDDIKFHIGRRLGLDERELKRRFRIADSITQKSIQCPEKRIRLRVYGSDPRYAHGRRTSLALLDEPAQWITTQGRDRKMYNAVKTSLGKHENSKLIALGTMPDDDADPDNWFTNLINSNQKNVHSVFIGHIKDEDQDPSELLFESTWRPVNPLVEHNSALLETIRQEAEAVIEGTGDINSFKALRLNMGTAEVVVGEALVDQAHLDLCCTDSLERGFGGYVLGIDAGSRSALSSATAVFANGTVEEFARVPASQPIPEGSNSWQRAIKDGLPIPCIKALIGTVIAELGEEPVEVICDNYRSADVKEACLYHGLQEPMIEHDTMSAHESVGYLRTICEARGLRWLEGGLLDLAIRKARCAVSADGMLKMARHDQAGRSVHTRDDPVAALLPAARLVSRLVAEPVESEVLQIVA